MTTVVYTDGACIGNPGPGGWAYAAPNGPFRSGADPHTTNQRMEITAALRALEDFDGELEVVSDSTYVVNCFKNRWWESWVTKGWLTAAKKPVANRDLWEPLVGRYRQRQNQIRFRWVKGHSSDVMNDVVDRLAADAARSQQGRSGVGMPADLGPPDRADSVAVPGRRIAVFGHRPPELDGWGGGPVTEAVKERLAAILRAKQSMHGGCVVLTGMNQGVETLAAEIGLPYVVVVAFPGQEDPWPAATKRHYRDLIGGATQVIEVGKEKPGDKIGFAKAYGARDREILKLADEAVIVWDGGDGPLRRLVEEARNALGEDEVWVVDLNELR